MAAGGHEQGDVLGGPSTTADPKVSAVVIFYNGADFLEEAVRSILEQNYAGSLEVLLVDDGSTDASDEIAKAFATADPQRVRYLQHPNHANRGAAATRNLGLSEARGELVAFLDCDDRWRPEKLAQQVAIFDHFPAVDAVFGGVNYWRGWAGGSDEIVPTGHVRDRPVPPPEAFLALYPFGKAAAPCPSDLMIRRSIALRIGGFEESFTGHLQLFEDQAFLTKLYLNATVYFAEAVWLDYRIHDRSCSSEVAAAGLYHDVRRHFLEWFAANVNDFAPGLDIRARIKVHRALLAYRHPALHRRLNALYGIFS